MENIIVAISNIPCILPIYTAFVNKDKLTAMSIITVSLASFVSHLVENHKHGMLGIGFSRKISYYLNRLDIAGCFIVTSRMLYLHYKKYGTDLDVIYNNKYIFLSAFSLYVILNISEYDKYNKNLKYLYIPTHCIWHIGIFITMNKYLSLIYHQ